MATLRNITVKVSDHDLELAQAYTEKGVTETVRTALRQLAQIKVQNDFRKLRGRVKFALTADELKYDRE